MQNPFHTLPPERRTIFSVLGAALFLGAVFYGLFWQAKGIGVNLLLTQLVFLLVVIGLSHFTQQRLDKHSWFPVFFSLFFAGAFAIWTSPLVLGVSMVGFLVSEMFVVFYAFGHHMEFQHPFQFFYDAGLAGIHALTRLTIFSHLPRRVGSKKLASVLVGLALLIPVLLLFTSLFASADLVFERYVDQLVEAFSFSKWIQHILGTLFFSVFFAAVLALAFWKRETFNVSLRFLTGWEIESAVVVAGVAVLFATFLLVQARYLFGGEAAFASMDMTFSAYARKGFNELVAVATLVLFLFLSLRFVHGERSSKLLQILYTVLFCETGLVLLSAVLRMNLYVEAYGYTQARFFTYWFLAAIATLLLLGLVHLWSSKPQAHFTKQGLVILGVFAMGFVISSPEAMALEWNRNRVLSRGFIEEGEVYQSSAEAYPFFVDLEASGVKLLRTPSEAGVVSFPPLAQAFAQAHFLPMYPRSDWRQWNWSRSLVDPTKPFPWFGCVALECRP